MNRFCFIPLTYNPQSSLPAVAIVFRRHTCHDEQHDDYETEYIEYAPSHLKQFLFGVQS